MSIADLSLEEFMEKDWGEESSGDDGSAKKRKPTKKKKSKSLNNNVKTKAQKTSKSHTHQTELNSLKDKDPEFYQFLQDEDSSLLNFDEKEFALSSDEDDNIDEDHRFTGELEEASSDSELEIASSGEEDFAEDEDNNEVMDAVQKKKKPLTRITSSMIESWKSRLSVNEPSLTALRQLLCAFHGALVNIAGEDEKKETKKGAKRRKLAPVMKYKIIDAATFNAVVGLCINTLPTAFAKILNFYPDKAKQSKKKKSSLPSSCSRWSSIRDSVRSYLTDAVALVQVLLEPSVTRVFLRHLLVLLPYFVSFPKIAKSFLKVLIKFWSSADDESVRVLSFFCLSKLIKSDKDRHLEKALKQCYLSYVANCKFTSPTTLPLINFMQQSFAEICAIDSAFTYRLAFLYIRQLAVHLRKAINTSTKETRQGVYNWQYVHSIALWCRVLSVLHPNETLHPLIYPLVQVALGTIDLVPTLRYYPLRFRILQHLTALGECTDTYIPLMSHITAPLKLQEFRKKPSGMSAKALSFDTILKLSNSQLKDKSYRDSTVDRVYDVLIAYLNSQAHTIAFPEMSVPAIVSLKRFIKDCKTPNYCKILKQIVDKVDENSEYIRQKRSEVTFDVRDTEAVNAWERRLHDDGVPFHKHYDQYKVKRQRELVKEIADRNRNVEEKLPSVDRTKFLEKKIEDKKEFSELFQEDSDEDFELTFEKAMKDGGFKKRMKFSDSENSTEPMEDQEEDSADEAVEITSPKKVDLGSDDEEDLVEDLQLSDSD